PSVAHHEDATITKVHEDLYCKPRRVLRALRGFVIGSRSRSYRIAAVIPATPSVAADASARSNSSLGYTPRTIVAATATASATVSDGLDVGSEPMVSCFRYMNTTMRT